MINNNYINSLANLAPWNMTTVIRTHYLIKPHVMDRKVNRMTKSSKIKNVFYVLENDYEIGLKEKSLRINHAHLLIAGDSSITRHELAKLVGINFLIKQDWGNALVGLALGFACFVNPLYEGIKRYK